MAYPTTIRPITVEINVNGTWEDISPYFLQHVTGTITRGAGGENNSMPPTTMNLTLNNADGRFTRENPLSPYYPYLRQAIPIRYTVEHDSVSYSRFFGEVIEWPEATLDIPQNSRVSIEATGLFRRLERSLPLRSPLTRTTMASGAITGVTSTLVAYWPMEDESENAQTLASGIAGRPAMDIKQPISVANYSGFDCSYPIPTLGTGQVSGPIAPHTTVTVTAPGQYTFEFLYHVSSAVGVDDTTIASLFFQGGTVSRVSILAHTNGDLRVRTYDHFGAITNTSSYVGTFTSNDTDIKIVLSLLNSGANLIYALSTLVEGDRVTVPSIGGTFGTAANVGQAIYAVFGLFNNADISVGHATVYTGQPPNYADVTYAFHAYIEERAGTRAQRLAMENNVPIRLIGDPALTPRMGPQPLGTLKDVLEQCPEVDHSLLFESRDELGITFLMRNALYNQTAGTRIGPDMPCTSTGTTTTAVLGITYKDYWRVGDTFQLRLISDDSLVEATTFTVTDVNEGVTNLTLTFTPAAAATTGTTKELARTRAGLLALSYADHELQPPARPLHDDRLTVNSIEVSRDNGSSFLAQQETGPRSIQDPPNGIGIYPDTTRLNLYSDGELAEHAYWLLNQGLVDDARWPTMDLGLHSAALVSRQAELLRFDVGHRVTIADMASVHIYDTQHQLARGYSETFDGNRVHHLIVNGVPERLYHVLQFDNAACRWAAQNSTLAEAITDSYTGAVEVNVGDSPWTITGGHFPQDVMLGGEQVTISGITGTGSNTPTFVGSGATDTDTSNNTLTPGLPAGTASGDVVFIYATVGTLGNSTPSIDAPANWSTSTTGTTQQRVMWREYDGVWTMPNITCTSGSAAVNFMAQSFAFRDVDSIEAPGTSGGVGLLVGPNPGATGIPVAWSMGEFEGARGLLLAFAWKFTSWASVDPPTGFLEAGELDTTNQDDAGQTVAYQIGNVRSGSGVFDVTTPVDATARTRYMTMFFPATGTQTFTISARAVNGAVVAHSVGEPVQVADRFHYGL